MSSLVVPIRRGIALVGLTAALVTILVLAAAPERAVGTQAPDDVATGRLMAPGDCGVRAAVLLPDPAEVNASRSVTSGWIREGQHFVGDLSSAVAAFGGELVASDENQAWIIQTTREGDVARQLRRYEGADGSTQWLAADTIKKTAC